MPRGMSVNAANKTTMTKTYKNMYDRIVSAIDYAKADQAYARVLINASDKRASREGNTLLRSATARLAEQRKALSIFLSDSARAYSRDEIHKFWD